MMQRAATALQRILADGGLSPEASAKLQEALPLLGGQPAAPAPPAHAPPPAPGGDPKKPAFPPG